MAHILFLLTSNDKLGNTGNKTGFHLEEAAKPYLALKEEGHEITFATIGGQAAPIDPSSREELEKKDPDMMQEFFSKSKKAFEDPENVEVLKDDDFDAIFLPGGHGTMWDLPESDAVADLVSNFYQQGKLVAAVCHGPAGFVNATKSDGKALVSGLKVNCFTDQEEKHVDMDGAMPFLLETRLRELGGKFENAGTFGSHAVRDGNLVTGQNPNSLDEIIGLMKNVLNAYSDTHSKVA